MTHRLARKALTGIAALAVAVGALAAAAPVAAEEPGSTVTVRPDPSYQGPEFEGWGSSLVWSANITGGYPDEIRDTLVDMVYGEDGLRLNIARYNIGGGNAPDVRDDYMKLGATMEGFWKAPEGTTREDMDWWDPDNSDHWNWDADANQRWWIDAIKDRVDHWEAFSNSPPWFQTVNGYVSGPFTARQDSIREDTLDDFATYLVRVTEHIEAAHGIEFDTIDPLNEPNTPYWTTTLGPDGQPVGGRQEGVHAGPALQEKVIRALHEALQDADTDAVISAMDETNPGIFVQNWNAYSPAGRAAVDQLNVHTYGTGQRTAVRDIAKGEGKRLWMSEVEGSFHSPTDYTTMETGLGIASRIVNDMRELEPSAWVLWQPIEDTGPQVAGNGNWGSIHIPFTCTDEDTLETCQIQTNTKFDTLRNFTHHIRPGDRFVKVNDTASVAALSSSASAATVVHVNTSTASRAVTVDLSLFRHVSDGATVTPIVSSSAGGLVSGEPVAVMDRTATVVVPAKSVTTLVVDGVHGVAKDAVLVQPDHVYRLEGVQSGRSLAPSDGAGVVIRTNDSASPDQLWHLEKLTGGFTNQERHTVVNVGSGERLALRSGVLVLEDADMPADDAAQWIMSTTGDGSWTFVNAETGRLLDVSGHATADGSPVTTWTPTSGANQRWRVADETVMSFEPVEVFTMPGVAPVLPGTVTAVYRDGASGELDVTWEPLPDSRWKKPGLVRVPGVATDAVGQIHDVHATVVVDVITYTEPARAKAFAGGLPALPETVVGRGDHGGRVELQVTWDEPPAGAFDAVGVVPLAGSAQAPDGNLVDATVRVQVTEPVESNVASEDGVSVTATFTESGYSPQQLVSGNRGEKAWSNWKPGDTKNPSDTVTLSLAEAHDVTRVVTYFYQDGSNTSVAESLRVEAQDADGAWVDVSGEIEIEWDGSTAPIVDVAVPTASTDGVRVVMAARPSGYLTLSEIEVLAATPGVSSDARAMSIEVNGEPIAGFHPDATEYQVPGAPGTTEVTATASDPYASVDIRHGERGDRPVVFVTVTSEDGSESREYRIDLLKR